jgi:tetratricopeptide (TPR) repeat protein
MLFSVIESARFASSSLQQGLQQDAAMADVYCEYGNLLDGIGVGPVERSEDAEEAYLKALELQPEHVGALRSYALLLDRSGRSGQALYLPPSA